MLPEMRTERRPKIEITTEENGLHRIKFLGEAILPIGGNHFLMESWSEDEAHHAIDSEEWTCSCDGWKFTKFCRHIEVIRRLIRETKNTVSDAAISRSCDSVVEAHADSDT